jgi:endoglycosylceramidase
MARHRGKAARSKIVGAVAFLALVVPSAPPAHADFDGMMDGLFDPFVTAAGAVDGEALFSPAAWPAFLAPEHWDAALAPLA